MDERVARDHGPIARLDRPQAVVVVLEAADAELLVEQPDRVNDLAADQQAEAHQPVDIDAKAMMVPAPVPSEPVQLGKAVVAGLDLLRAADTVGAWAGQPDRGIAVSAPSNRRSQPVVTTVSLFKSRTWLAGRRRDPLVDRGRKTTIHVVDDQPHAVHARRYRQSRQSSRYRRRSARKPHRSAAGGSPGTAACIRAGCE